MVVTVPTPPTPSQGSTGTRPLQLVVTTHPPHIDESLLGRQVPGHAPGGRETPAVTTTTTLVHRPYDGPEEWWRHALVYEIPSPALGAAELDRTTPIVKHARYLGMDAVLIRPSLLDIDTEMDSIRRFIDDAGEQGLRTIVRISGALGPITGPYAKQTTGFVTGLEGAADDLLRRSEAYLQAGAAGIDLGTIVPPQLTSGIRLDRLSTYCAMLHGQLAEYVDEGIIGADVTADYPESLRHHLQDDWVHHLRDDCLTLTRWNAESLTSHLTRSLDEHDRFGAPPPGDSCLPTFSPSTWIRATGSAGTPSTTRNGCVEGSPCRP